MGGLEAMLCKLQAECDTLRTINASNEKIIKLTMESQMEQIKYFQSLPGCATSYPWLPQQKAVYSALTNDEQDHDDQKSAEPHERNRNSKTNGQRVDNL